MVSRNVSTSARPQAIEVNSQQLQPSSFICEIQIQVICHNPDLRTNQFFVFYLLESPYHSGSALRRIRRDYFNITMTYRYESVVIKWVDGIANDVVSRSNFL
uniref:Fucosyltransferase N-terminal domain-containing protein n=1 Tax=Parascaris univalens TaxID=6257 RepID=A0A914ZWZ3_PARUN